MAELYSNQIKPSGVSQPRASAPQFSNAIGEALGRLGDTMDHIMQKKAAIDDERLARAIQNNNEIIEQNIQNAQSGTTDYDGLYDMAYNSMDNVLKQFSPDTVNRFMNKNPGYMEKFDVGINALITKKTADDLVLTVGDEIPSWTTQAISKGTPEARNEVITKITDKLQGIATPKQVQELVFKANSIMDMATANNLLVSNPEKLISILKNNPEQLGTIDAYEASVLVGRANNAIKDRLTAAQSDDIDNNPLLVSALNTFALFARTGQTDKMTKMFVDVQRGMSVIDYGEEIIDAEGRSYGRMFSLGNVSEMQRLALMKKMKEIAEYNPDFKADLAKYNNDMTNVLTKYLVDSDNHSSGRAEDVALLLNAQKNSMMFNQLPDGDRKESVRIVTEEDRARNEKLETTDYFANGWGFTAYKEQNPRSVIQQMLTSHEQEDAAFLIDVGNQTAFFRPTQGWSEEQKQQYGRALKQAMLDYRDEFERDMEDNSSSEYAMLCMFDVKNIQGTDMAVGRFANINNTSLNHAWYKTVSDLKANNIYNTLSKENGDQAADLFFGYLLGGNPTSDELHTINTIKDRALYGQANREYGMIGRAFNTPATKSVYKPDLEAFSRSPFSDTLEINNKLIYNKKQKAIKKAMGD